MTQLSSTTPVFYGLESRQHAVDLARLVCSKIGTLTTNYDLLLLLETACAETQLGAFPDKYAFNGYGLLQADEIGVVDVIARTKVQHKQTIKREFGIDLNTVIPPDLEKNPLLAFIVARLHYMLRPEPIPRDMAGRALYWKRFYNTEAGKGTVEHYLKSAHAILHEGGLI